MTFLTPTLLAGDRSLVSVLAHELAHSWTGNLVTNATNEDFWLNEGWTVYAERRIVEELYGEEAARAQARLGRVTLEETLEELESAGKRTALSYPQEGLDPDAEFSKVPYEKGFLLVTALERAVGRERFDAFIQEYITRFRFKTLRTAAFADFVREALPEAAAKIDLDTWLYADGLPDDAPVFRSARLEELGELADGWTPDQRPPPTPGPPPKRSSSCRSSSPSTPKPPKPSEIGSSSAAPATPSSSARGCRAPPKPTSPASSPSSAPSSTASAAPSCSSPSSQPWPKTPPCAPSPKTSSPKTASASTAPPAWPSKASSPKAPTSAKPTLPRGRARTPSPRIRAAMPS